MNWFESNPTRGLTRERLLNPALFFNTDMRVNCCFLNLVIAEEEAKRAQVAGKTVAGGAG